MFWDSSALVPLVLKEARSRDLAERLSKDREPVTWWTTPIECRSALHRRDREGLLPKGTLARALEILDAILMDMDVVVPTEPVRQRACRALSVHPLRVADALQLAAALAWCEDKPAGELLVTLDERLRDAAQREGFVTVPE